MSLDSLHPDERKRILAALQKDKSYTGSRNALLLVSLVSAICLSIVGWLVIKNLMTMWVSIAVICACIVTYAYFALRVVKIKKATLGRWMAKGVIKKEKSNKSEKKMMKKKDRQK